jgi:hypothetical protein
MKLRRVVRKAGYKTLMLMFCVMLLQNLTQGSNDKTRIEVKEHFISSSNHLSDLMSDEEQSNPADTEEDEDGDEGEAVFVFVKFQEFTFSAVYKSHQDHLFRDPQLELISPPPKA